MQGTGNNFDNGMVNSRPVAFVRSRFTTVQGMPIQTAAAAQEEGVLEVVPEFEDALQGIDGFEYLILITHLHRGELEPLRVTPFLDDQEHGVFATRAPARPNRLGLSIVRLQRREGMRLFFSGNDMLDQTPVLDIKPFVPEFDNRETSLVGWYASRIENLRHTRADDRMER